MVQLYIFIEYMLPKCLLAHFKITLPSFNISFEIIAIHDLFRIDPVTTMLFQPIEFGGGKVSIMHLSPIYQTNFNLKTLPAVLMHLLVLHTLYKEKQRQDRYGKRKPFFGPQTVKF